MDRVHFVEWVSGHARRLGGVEGRRPIRPEDIHPMWDGLEVARVRAGTQPAEVVYGPALRDGPALKFVGGPMRYDLSPIALDFAVAATAYDSGPEPAAAHRLGLPLSVQSLR